MVQQRFTLLNNLAIRAALEQAWEDSQSGVERGHEEGGFILLSTASELSVVRWPKGEFVIAQEKIYLVFPNGQVSEIGDTWEVFGEK